jgi:hypothetical protein
MSPAGRPSYSSALMGLSVKGLMSMPLSGTGTFLI